MSQGTWGLFLHLPLGAYMPALLPAVLPLIPKGLGALASLFAVLIAYVLTQRQVEARLHIR